MKKLFLFSTLLSLCLIGIPLSAQYQIKDMSVKVEIDTAGFIDVEETISVFFSERRRGIIRSIPTAFVTKDNVDLKVGIGSISVPGFAKKVSRKNNSVNIRIGSPDKFITGEKKYIIRYKVFNPFLHLSDRVEFNWNMTGTVWDVPIEKGSYQVVLPDDQLVYDGDFGAYETKTGFTYPFITYRKTGNIISGEFTEPLNPGEGVSVAINFPEGYISKYQSTTSAPVTSKSKNKPKDYGYPLVGLLAAGFVWLFRKLGRNKHRSDIPATFYPPENMSAARVGTFHDYTAHTSDLISLIPDWGNRGLIEVKSLDYKDELYFTRKGELPSDAPEYERIMWNGLFKEGDMVYLSTLKQKFYTTLASAKFSLKKSILNPELYDADAKKWFHSNYSILVFVLCIVIGIGIITAWKALFSGILFFILGFIILIVRFLRPKLSEEGQYLHDQLEALKIFLENPDPEQLNKLTTENPSYLELIYPYVVAFGIDATWNKTMLDHGYDTATPSWFMMTSQTGNNQPASFSDFGKSFNVKEVTSVFSSAPRSSGGSSGGGFSGGSSGGGFGGGGGSSW